MSAAEGEGPFDVWNPTYELTQFRFAIEVGQTWRTRLGLPRRADWDDVLANLAPPPIITLPDGTRVYNRHQNCLPSVFDPHAQHCQGTQSHPALTGALGCLPLGVSNGSIDRAVMNATLHETLRVFGDRLIEDADRAKFHAYLMECMQTNFECGPDTAVLERIRGLDTSGEFTHGSMRALMFGNLMMLASGFKTISPNRAKSSGCF